MKHLKVENHVNLVRDQTTKAILNTDTDSYNEYIILRNLKKEKNQKVETIESELENLKKDINEIKDLLKELGNGSK
jgi:hypothetical protein